MRKYSVYRHPTKGLDAVKEGFSWPGFLFTWLWAAAKRLWGMAALLAVLHFVQLGLTAADDPALGLLGLGLVLAIVLTVGFKGNDWREDKLRRTDWEFLQTVSVRTGKAAMEQATGHQIKKTFTGFEEIPESSVA